MQIKQMLSPGGWQAGFKKDDNTVVKVPLVAWGLTEWADGASRVEGLVVDDKEVKFCFKLDSFVGYFQQMTMEDYIGDMKKGKKPGLFSTGEKGK